MSDAKTFRVSARCALRCGAAWLVLLLLVIILPGCAKQYDMSGGAKGGKLVFHPFAKAQAKGRAERFLRAYLGGEPGQFKLHSVTRWVATGATPYWAYYYSDLGVDTGVIVEIEEKTGRGRIKRFLGNVLLSDNVFAVRDANDVFRDLNDFRRRLAAQNARARHQR